MDCSPLPVSPPMLLIPLLATLSWGQTAYLWLPTRQRLRVGKEVKDRTEEEKDLKRRGPLPLCCKYLKREHSPLVTVSVYILKAPAPSFLQNSLLCSRKSYPALISVNVK